MNLEFSSRRSVLQMLVGTPMFLGVSPSAGKDVNDRSKTQKILMPIGDATEVVDTLYPFFRVAEDGYRPVVAGPEARMYHMVLHEIPPASNIPWDITEERPGYHIAVI